MTYGTWQAMAMVFFIIAAAFLITAIIMFFSFDIRTVRKELSGKHIETYMEDYRQKRDQNKRVKIYDPSGKLITDVKSANIGKSGGLGRSQNSMSEALAKSRATASVKNESGTQVLSASDAARSDFVITKDYIYTYTSEYIG